MELVIGQKYKKSDFGISGIVRQWSEITVQGELFSFFSFDNRFDNEIVDDGFIYECRGVYGLIPFGIQKSIQRNVFFREARGEDYTYLGKGQYEKRNDERRNKVFWCKFE